MLFFIEVELAKTSLEKDSNLGKIRSPAIANVLSSGNFANKQAAKCIVKENVAILEFNNSGINSIPTSIH
jgi:hypothetical protein